MKKSTSGNSDPFKYNGLTFKPFMRISQTFEEVSKHISSDRDLGFSRYSWAKHSWNYDEFYKASGNSDSDLFICLENGNTYIPGENELFLYNF